MRANSFFRTGNAVFLADQVFKLYKKSKKKKNGRYFELPCLVVVLALYFSRDRVPVVEEKWGGGMFIKK